MSLSGLSLEEAFHRVNPWLIDDWPFRVILLASSGVIFSARGSLRWRTDNMCELELSWLDGSVVVPFNESVEFFDRDPGPIGSEYPEFPAIGGPEPRYSDCLEFRFDFGRLLLLRFDLSMFDPPDLL